MQASDIYFYFNSDGSFREFEIEGDGYILMEVYINNNVISDNALDCVSADSMYNDARSIKYRRTGFFVEPMKSALPDWIGISINTDSEPNDFAIWTIEGEGSFDIFEYSYRRQITFTAEPNRGAKRELIYQPYTDLGKSATIHIIQDSADLSTKTIGVNYRLFKDSVILDTIKNTVETAYINLEVDSSGTDYSFNKISPCGTIYQTLPDEAPVEFNTFALLEEGYEIELSDWISYSLEAIIPRTPQHMDEYKKNWPHCKAVKFAYGSYDGEIDRIGFIKITSKRTNTVMYDIKVLQRGVKQDTPVVREKAEIQFKHHQLYLPYNTGADNKYCAFSYKNVSNITASISTQSTWMHVVDVRTTDPDNSSILIKWDTNVNSSNRTCTIKIQGESTIDNSIVIDTISMVQYANGIGSDTIEIEDVEQSSFIAIDDNTGEDYDPTALLFKDNNANIYSTIESKDNTLFLGNYTTRDLSLALYNSFGPLRLNIDEDTIEVQRASNINTSVYSYTPNMLLNSQEKRIFKKGETYSLGLVFIKNNGVKSSVFYIGNFKPTSDPVLQEVQGESYTKMIKRIASVGISSEMLKKLKDENIIGILPVYAKRDNHKVICQGFLNPTITSHSRKTAEGLSAQYNWFQRTSFTGRAIGESGGEISAGFNVEFQCTDYNDYTPEDGGEATESWKFNSKIITMNTPEVEVSELLTNSDIVDSVITPVYVSNNINFTNNVTFNVSGKYIHSRIITPKDGWPLNTRSMRELLWYGFGDDGGTNETKPEFNNLTNDSSYYVSFYVYPWQRNKIGGEGASSITTYKRYFTSIFIEDYRVNFDKSPIASLNKANIYQEDYPALLKFGTDVYQGNIDYIININGYGYHLFSSTPTKGGVNYPKANTELGVYAGYNTDGYSTDPIYMRYKCAEHIVLNFSNNVNLPDGIICAELTHSDNSYNFDSDSKTLSSFNWIKCGDIVPITSDINTATVKFVEGDYFYGRFDTLRTYPYANDDVNSVTDIVSGMLCSRVNLDARCDRNRGIGSALVTPENFNIFNEVYNQDNNYFIYRYFDLSEKIYSRKYSNSIQWSMTKNYGNEIDDWCNIQEINTLDLDGNKGKLTALKRFSNNLLAFQDSGISQILYNESVQVAATTGVPIEIANSGKVTGKRYLHDNIGCQNIRAIASTPLGIYFVDDMNTKTFYRYKADNSLEDICLTGGMKSWSLKKDTGWLCWYDPYTQEIIFNTDSESIIYSDIFSRFQCFSSYEGIKDVMTLSGRTYMFKKTTNNNFTYNTLWLKNSTNDSTFFSIPKDIEIELISNPEPILDKTFSNIEYRADCFDSEGEYMPDSTFSSLQVTTEYQDTGIIQLGLDKSNLRKKFRMWNIDIPRDIKTRGRIDRIRNPWCKIKFTMSNREVSKFIVHDIAVKYF